MEVDEHGFQNFKKEVENQEQYTFTYLMNLKQENNSHLSIIASLLFPKLYLFSAPNSFPSFYV